MTSLPLPPRPTGVSTEIEGFPVVLHFGDVQSEYAALRTGAIVVDRGHRRRVRISGPKAAEVVTGLVTNDVGGLAPGQGCYAAALTPKGKIVADVRILVEEGSLLADVPTRAAAGWTEMLRKYVNPRLAPWHDESLSLAAVGVYGAQSRRIAAETAGVPQATLAALPPYGHLSADVAGARVLVVRSPDLGLEGYDLYAPAEVRPALWRLLADDGATPTGLAVWEIARIEAGRPEWGLDIDESTLAQEANMDELHAISYTKGCYVGQETVARVHFRGHVNRQLRGLRFPAGEPLPYKSALVDESGKSVGDLRSSAISPRLGGIGLAMVRREIEPGAQVVAHWEGGDSRVEIGALPFPL
jgi:tRNA-modifying protein YgfZ